MSPEVLSQDSVVGKIKKVFFEEIKSYLEDNLPELIQQEIELTLDNNNYDNDFKEQVYNMLNQKSINELLGFYYITTGVNIERILGVDNKKIEELDKRLANKVEELANEVLENIQDDLSDENRPD